MFFRLLLSMLFFSLFPQACLALQPNEILLVVNRAVPASIELARYYQQQRQIPSENLLQVRISDKEDCSREEYQQKLVAPVRKYLAQRPGQIRCLLLFYGLPLRVAAPELDHAEWKALGELKYRKKAVDWQLKNDPPDEGSEQLRAEADQLKKRIAAYRRSEQIASVDSELTLLQYEDYPLDRWVANPYFVGFRNKTAELPFRKERVLMVARLDAPSPEIVRRIIDDTLATEKSGLSGRAYFDARWSRPKKKNLSGYALYDASLHDAAELVKKISKLPVELDEKGALFQPGAAPQAALYAGWYSLGKYVDAFDWQPGAVAYHIASSECTTLKKVKSQVWCKRLLEDGVAATIGPVAEPYVQAFPLPEIFFTFLLDGYYTLVESYFLSSAYLSWQMVLLGDPLYRPFRNRL